ncbi:MAG: TauD/TfdA family dioxygenase [Proteobacteria bacterium]|nr:TauD/TfdA family dioxygenase [Pseudomonadota bacterium]
MINYDVTPIAGACGAEIHGIDISQDLSDEAIQAIRTALLDHLVVFFRDQDLTPDQHVAFGRRFGELNIDRFVVPMEGHPEVMVVLKEADETQNFGEVWHSDVTFQAEPAMGSILHAVEVPPFGGDTMWANQYLAYEALSDGMKRMLEELRAVHTARGGYGKEALDKRFDKLKRSMKIYRDRDHEAETEVTHPIVRTHPETGRKALYVNAAYTERIEDMTVAESRPILEYLYRHCARPEFTCRFTWSKGAVAFWDNRSAQHYPINDYNGFRREMHRVTVCGDTPI